jgi:hypothetical protein
MRNVPIPSHMDHRRALRQLRPAAARQLRPATSRQGLVVGYGPAAVLVDLAERDHVAPSTRSAATATIVLVQEWPRACVPEGAAKER